MADDSQPAASRPLTGLINDAKAGKLAGQTGWVVPDVPDVMYFNSEAEALHGAYWHNNFGNPMSHGCVNLTMDDAAWFYDFGFVGMAVRAHY